VNPLSRTAEYADIAVIFIATSRYDSEHILA